MEVKPDRQSDRWRIESEMRGRGCGQKKKMQSSDDLPSFWWPPMFWFLEIVVRSDVLCFPCECFHVDRKHQWRQENLHWVNQCSCIQEKFFPPAMLEKVSDLLSHNLPAFIISIHLSVCTCWTTICLCVCVDVHVRVHFSSETRPETPKYFTAVRWFQLCNKIGFCI